MSNLDISKLIHNTINDAIRETFNIGDIIIGCTTHYAVFKGNVQKVILPNPNDSISVYVVGVDVEAMNVQPFLEHEEYHKIGDVKSYTKKSLKKYLLDTYNKPCHLYKGEDDYINEIISEVEECIKEFKALNGN